MMGRLFTLLGVSMLKNIWQNGKKRVDIPFYISKNETTETTEDDHVL